MAEPLILGINQPYPMYENEKFYKFNYAMHIADGLWCDSSKGFRTSS